MKLFLDWHYLRSLTYDIILSKLSQTHLVRHHWPPPSASFLCLAVDVGLRTYPNLLPAFVGQLERLHSLNLAENTIGTLPGNFSRLVNLKELYLQTNKLDKWFATGGALPQNGDLAILVGFIHLLIHNLPYLLTFFRTLDPTICLRFRHNCGTWVCCPS